jgi:hypothetical protein
MSVWGRGYDEEVLDTFDGGDESFIEGASDASGDEALGDLEVLLLALFYHI